MKLTLVTTITTHIDMETMRPSHEIDVATDDPIPGNVAIAAAIGGCKTAIRVLEARS